MTDLPDPTAIAGRGPLADKLAGGGGGNQPPETAPPPPTYTGPDDAPPWVTFAGQSKADDLDHGDEAARDSRDHRKLVATITRLITNLPPAEAAEAIAAKFTPGGVPGAQAPQGEQRWEACSSCGALTLPDDAERHRDWHHAQAWKDDQ